MTARRLLAIVELGGYPNFAPVYEAAGYAVTVVTSMRKALALIRRDPPDVVVAEYNYQHVFRDRSSNLETLLSALQRLPQVQLIVFYEREQEARLADLARRRPIAARLAYPFDAGTLRAALDGLAPSPAGRA